MAAAGTSMRIRVWRLLRDGVPQTRAAEILGVSRGLVSYHARRLVEQGHLRLRVSSGSVRIYEAGAGEAHEPGKNGASRNGGKPHGAARIHRGCYKWAVQGPPQKEPPWERTWTAKRKGAVTGTLCRLLEYRVAGALYRIRETVGKSRRSLMVWPPEDWVSHPDDVAVVEHSRLKRAAAAVRAFAKEYGYLLGGVLSQIQPTEYGFAVQGGGVVGRPGIDTVSKDGSPPGSMEWDVQDNRIAESIVALPQWREEMERHLGAVEEEIPVQRGFLTRIVRAKQAHLENDRLTAQALVPPDDREVV